MVKLFKNARDPVSSFTHMFGAVLSIIGLLFVAVHAIIVPTQAVTLVSCLLFCTSLIALYFSSGFYHFSNGKQKVINILRKLDHAMIYVLIAGTYTPVLLKIFDYPKSIIFMSVIWGIAFTGIIIKMFWISAPRWLTTLIYILMGWAIAVDFNALASLETGAILLLFFGGMSYTVGGIMYVFKKPNFSSDFGFHETFHITCLIGSLLHYLMVYLYVL